MTTDDRRQTTDDRRQTTDNGLYNVMRETIVLREFEACDIEMSARDYSSLRSRYAGRLSITPTERPGIYRLTAQDYVGRICLPGGQTVVIEPKIEVANLFYMLCVDAGLVHFYQPLVRLKQNTEIFPFVLSALVSEAEKVLVKGVYSDYQAREEDLPLVRGRVALETQIARYGELRHRHICHYAQLSADTVENRIVAATLRQAALLLRPLTEVTMLRRVRDLLHRFEEVAITTPATALVAFMRVKKHRLNAHYWPLLGLCRLVLNGLSLSEGDGPHPFPSFLVNMPLLFESFLTARLRSALPGEGLRAVAQRHDYLDAARKVGIRPDLLVYGATKTKPLLVLDAKYKRLDVADAEINRDIYQVSAYMDRYSLSRGVLVYPSWGRPAPGEMRLLGTPKELHVATLNLAAASPAELDQECAKLTSYVATLARS
ncbi:MAG TPA: hypothetical protein VJ183_14310 [Chloroflexia bacterium]|nr:hypothetical protein [Chloroflexia bacterium]